MVSKEILKKAADEGLLESSQVIPLYDFLSHNAGPRFDFTHVLYYFGGLVAIGALTLFINLGWEQFGGWGIVTISLVYAVLGIGAVNTFRRRRRSIPAGICGAFVVALTPLAVYGLQQGMGWWPDSSNYRDYHHHIRFLWIYMELGTLAVGVMMLWVYRYPFLVMPVAATLWYMSMDITELVLGRNFGWRDQALITMWFGLFMTLLAFWVDIRSRKTLDYAFWLYLFGVLAFWGGLTNQHSDSELNKFLYFCVNLLLIGIGAVLVRKVFAVVGALGSCFYLSHLAYKVFEESWAFPVVLTVLGFSIIWMGILWQKNEESFSFYLKQKLPTAFRELLEHRGL